MPRSLASLDGWFKQIITAEKRRQMRNGVASAVSTAESIRKGIHRVPGASETVPVVKPLHHYVFCSHNVPYWRTCTKCGRDKHLAQRNAQMILNAATKLP